MGDGSTPGRTPGTPAPSGATAAPSFQERLWPTFGVWVVVVLMALLFGIIGLRFGVADGVITFVVAAGVLVVLLVSSTPTIRVGPELFVAGGAHIPLSLLGGAETLDDQAMPQAMGVDLDARAFLCTRGWLKQGVRVQLEDPEDPTPYWLVSTRHPTELAAALEAARRSA
jgi:hypothetical protein